MVEEIVMIKLRLNLHGTEIKYEGKAKHFKTSLPQLLDLAASSHNGQVKRDLLALNDDLVLIRARLDGLAASIAASNEEFKDRVGENKEKFEGLIEKIATLGDSPDELFSATGQLREMNASFSMQYLQMQQKIQQETREFNLLSNVMKTKHEAAKNAVNNIR